MNDSERNFAVRYLEQTRDHALALAHSLTPEQRDFRPAADNWTAAELLEHIVVVENLARSRIENTLSTGSPDESRRGKGFHKDKIVLEDVPARIVRAPAPELAHPKQRWPDFDELLRQFMAARARTVELARTTQADLRAYFAPHPLLGDLDCYQWLLLISSHCERHVRQAEEGLGIATGSESAGSKPEAAARG